MMQTIKIGLVEDETVIAMTLVNTLKKLNYNAATPACNYAEALDMIEKEHPDLLLLDINLGGQKDGIDVAGYVRKHYNLPIIFLTAHSDTSTVQRAKLVKPNAYLLKPFTKNDLFAAIEIAIHSYEEGKTGASAPDELIVKSGQDYIKLPISDLVFMENSDNYVTIHLASGKQVLVRSTLAEMQDRLSQNSFFRISRSVIVHVALINKIESDKIYVGSHQLTISPKVKKELLLKMG